MEIRWPFCFVTYFSFIYFIVTIRINIFEIPFLRFHLQSFYFINHTLRKNIKAMIFNRHRKPMRPRVMSVGRRMRGARGRGAVRMSCLRRHANAGVCIRPQHVRLRVQDAHARLPGRRH